MATGLAWNLSNPTKPYADFDLNAVRNIPCNWNAWLTDIGSTYASHTMIAATPLEVVSSAQAAGIITALIRFAVAGAPVVGTKYPVTFRITAANGEIDDQTLYLKAAVK